jgi:hypothetical protein
VNPKLFAAGAACTLALAGAGIATAGDGHGKYRFQADVAASAKATHVGSGSLFAAATAYLQVDRKTLFASLKSGQTLAQIAVAQGKTSDGLIDAVVLAAKTKLDAKVAAGRIDAAREATLLADLRAGLGTLVTKSFVDTKVETKLPHVHPLYLTAVLDYLQIDATTLRAELKAGKSLAQVAAAHGKTTAGLTAAILGPIQVQLDGSVASGRLTAAQRAALLAKIEARVSAALNASKS